MNKIYELDIQERHLSTVSAYFTSLLWLMLQKTWMEIGGFLDNCGEDASGAWGFVLHSYLCRAAGVKSSGLLRECLNKQSFQSFPNVLTGISTGNVIRLATIKLFW